MKCLLIISCLLPVLFGKPSPFFGSFDRELPFDRDHHDWLSDKEYDCAEHLHETCVTNYLRPELSSDVKPSFETCRVFDFMNCIEREINATTECHRDGKVNQTRIRSVQFNFVKAKKCPCAEDFDHLIEMLIDPDYFLNPNVFVFGHFQNKKDEHSHDKEDHHDEDGDHHDEDGDHHDEDGDHHDEDGDHHDENGDHHDEDGDHHDEDGDKDHSDWWTDFEDSGEEKENATTAAAGEENDTKNLFEKGLPDEEIDEWTTANETKNDTTDSFYDEMGHFISSLTDLMTPDDSWNDWEEDNDDDMNTEGEDHFAVNATAGMDCNGMGCNSSDHSANMTESVDGDSSSEPDEEGFGMGSDGSFPGDGFPHTTDGSLDELDLQGDDLTGDLGTHDDDYDASHHPDDSSYMGGSIHADEDSYDY